MASVLPYRWACRSDVLPLYVGDDLTDENALRVIGLFELGSVVWRWLAQFLGEDIDLEVVGHVYL
jgi:trehalose-6-phosphatase